MQADYPNKTIRDESPSVLENEFRLLEALATTPNTSQAELASQAGIAVGTVNWYVKRWTEAGYLSIQRVGHRQWHYHLTREGFAHRRHLTHRYIEMALAPYRQIRGEAKQLIHNVIQQGTRQIALLGEGELMEICRLTCLEMQIDVIDISSDNQAQSSELQLRISARQRYDSAMAALQQTDVANKLHDVPLLCADGLHLVLYWPSEKS